MRHPQQRRREQHHHRVEVSHLRVAHLNREEISEDIRPSSIRMLSRLSDQRESIRNVRDSCHN